MPINRNLFGSAERLNYNFSEMTHPSLKVNGTVRPQWQFDMVQNIITDMSKNNEVENKIWFDSDLYVIPILRAPEDDIDHKIIMEKFHASLMLADDSKKSSFIDLWTYLIVTATDAFDPNKRKDPMFQIVYSTVGLSTPRERSVVELDLNEHFGDSLTGVDFPDMDFSKTLTIAGEEKTAHMNDKKFNEWYKSNQDLDMVRAWFGVYCLNLMRCYFKQEQEALESCAMKIHMQMHQFMGYPGPSHVPRFETKTFNFVKKCFQSAPDQYRRILRMVLDLHLLAGSNHRSLMRDRFFTYAIKIPLEFIGLSIPKFIAAGMGGHRMLALMADEIERHPNVIIRSSFETYFYMCAELGLIKCQDEEFIRDNPDYKGQTVELWTYSRAIDSRYFGAISNTRNKEFLAYCAGFSGQTNISFTNIVALRGLPNAPQFFGDGTMMRSVLRKGRGQVILEAPSTNVQEVKEQGKILAGLATK